MHPFNSFHEYPRRDKQYQAKHSLDFDMMRSRIMLKRGGSQEETRILWITHAVCGLLMGTAGFLLILFEDLLVTWRSNTVQKLIDSTPDDVLWESYLFYAGSAVTFVAIACLLTIHVAPAAAGSGVAEIVAMLNGINYDKCVNLNTLFVKYFGTLFAVVSGLCIGKEGPLVHIGGVVGVVCCYMPLKDS